MNRYHLVIFKVPSPSSLPEEEVAIVDEEFDGELVTQEEVAGMARRFVTRATENLVTHADRSTGEAHADLKARRDAETYSGYGEMRWVDPDVEFLAGHEAGYMRGLA